MNLFTTIKASL